MFKGKETTYSLGIFPIGGYIKMEGEDPPDKPSEEKQRKYDWPGCGDRFYGHSCPGLNQ